LTVFADVAALPNKNGSNVALRMVELQQSGIS